jgi:predicted NUDIX family phosphoesterase
MKILLKKGYTDLTSNQGYFKELLNQKAYYHRREEAEVTPTMKQLTPYVLVFNSDGTKILTFSRGKKSGESRLHGKRAIGFGGHIDLVKSKGLSKFEEFNLGFKREMKEELDLEVEDINVEGVVYNPDEEVSSVHLGVITTIKIDEDKFNINSGETDIQVDRHFSRIKDININDYESWSQLVLEDLKTRSSMFSL